MVEVSKLGFGSRGRGVDSLDSVGDMFAALQVLRLRKSEMRYLSTFR